ncbi:hypothetical protein MBLNU459_g5741t4 [Dothideomycetes sp. NU459]
MTSGTGANRSRAGPTFLPSLEKARFNDGGRATPESEAIGSSDEDVELSKSVSSLTGTSTARALPSRRKSFLSEIQSGGQRKMSVTGMSLPSNGSQPTTPSGEFNPWTMGSALGRVPSGGGSTSGWSQSANIWNEPRREASGRLAQATAPATGPVAGSYSFPQRTFGEESIAPVNMRENIDPAAFPFSIPLQPTVETYRSLSYSVGQSEENEAAGQALQQTRTRQTAATNLKHRPVRPSTLREENEPQDPKSSRERDDDEESFGGSDHGVRLPANSNVFNNPLLRQATHENARATQRVTFPHHPASTEDASNLQTTMDFNSYNPSGTDVAIIEEGEASASQMPRRYSTWQTTLGFGQLEELPQSRRHSFAELPTRRGSLAAPPARSNAQAYGSVAAAYANVTDSPESAQMHQQIPARHTPSDMQASMEQSDRYNRAYAATYFSGVAPAMRSQYEANASQPGSLTTYRPAAAFQRPGQNCLLYMVSFKCARADAYFVQEGTGLQVKDGDLVIVEADRGHDLGTVTHSRVSWARARELKAEASDEHYRWLMMFSRYNKTVTSKTVNPNSTMAKSNLAGTDRELNKEQEMKPKMIKRLAQPHEIATLRDKEGNEAKAKRVCQQKAQEHGLDMEILDGEFQTDWKKLTFYYFSERYVNFNILVTDLFKMYKTRIWMSAINPASFASAPNQHPSGVGPGALQGRDSPMDPRVSAQPFTPGSLSYQDIDPIGAVPPSRNPNSSTYHELALANRQAKNGRASQKPAGTQPLSSQFTFNDNPYGATSQDVMTPFGGSPSMAVNQGSFPTVTSGNRSFMPAHSRSSFNPTATPYGQRSAPSPGVYYNPTAAPVYFGANAQNAQAGHRYGFFNMAPQQQSEGPFEVNQAMRDLSLSKDDESGRFE